MRDITEAEARDVLGQSTGPVSATPLTHNPKNGVTAGVRTVTAGDRTAVLKVLTRTKEATGRWAASDDPRHGNYWLREAEVYDSGLAQTWQPYGIRAPRLLARHIEHARRLGAAQGAAPTGPSPATAPSARTSATTSPTPSSTCSSRPTACPGMRRRPTRRICTASGSRAAGSTNGRTPRGVRLRREVRLAHRTHARPRERGATGLRR
ncbi:hypothetical protein ACFWP5_07110 [Streptomyces sp. NPDC058469]|uniref:hypothetical protein n=1 Tax=Streptomyces sp. NPDC058469 TaxID=3346514 RepID=UPI00365DC0E1